MIRHSRLIPRPWNNEPITSRVSAFMVCILTIILFGFNGLLQGAVDCAWIKDRSDEPVKKDAKSFHPDTASSLFNCPKDWTNYKNGCFMLIQTPLAWDEAEKVCDSYGGVLADLATGDDWIWMDNFIWSHFSEQSGDTSTPFSDISVPSIENTIGLWAGVQRFPNGTFLWSDGLHKLVIHPGFRKEKDLNQGLQNGRMCSEISLMVSSRRSRQWHVTDCEQAKPFVCRRKACFGSMFHCPRESRCVQPEWICDGHVDCETPRDEMMCNKRNLKNTSQVTFCGETFKIEQGSFVSPNQPSSYPPLSHCVWTLETDLNKVLIISVHNVDIEDKFDSLEIYDGVTMTKSNLIKDVFSSNHSHVVMTAGSYATIRFLSDATNHRTGFRVSWTSETRDRNTNCGGKVLVTKALSVIDFNASQLNSSKTPSSHPIVCDWLLTSDSTDDHLSLQISSLELNVGESLKVFDGSELDDAMMVHYSYSQIGTQMVIGSNRGYSQWLSRVVTLSTFIPAPFVSFKSTVRIQLTVRTEISTHARIVFHLGCDNSISNVPAIIPSPGIHFSRYPNGLNCSWNFQQHSILSTKHSSLLLFPGFLTEEGKDILQIQNQTPSNIRSPGVVQFSGSIDELHTLSFISDFSIQFSSDSTVNKGHWIVVVSNEECDLQKGSHHLIINVSDTRIGAQMDFACEEGYTLVGHDTAFCDVFGMWNPKDWPVCLVTSCGSPPIPRNGYLTSLTGTTFGNVSFFQCHNGFNLHGNQSSVCGSLGWSQIPSCHEIMCPKEQPPDGGKAKAEELELGALREYFCKPPLRLIGSKFSHCNASGVWTDEVPTCQPPGCPFPPRLVNGKFNETGSVNVGHTIEAFCNQGFVVEGPTYLTCQDHLGFGSLLPRCTDVNECLSAHQPCNTHYCQNYHGGFHCMCQPGYRHPEAHRSTECVDVDECEEGTGGCSHKCTNMPGNYSCQCPPGLVLYDGQETFVRNQTLVPFHSCIAICPPLTAPGNGHIVYKSRSLDCGNYIEGTIAIMKCPSGSYLNGESMVTCNIDGRWSQHVSQCKEYMCDALLHIWNGDVSYDSLIAGSHAIYSCFTGFKLKGSRYRFCLPTGARDERGREEYRWTGLVPICEITSCPSLSNPTHGQVFVSSLSYKAKAVFKCECGYRLIGRSSIECTASGNWSDVSPFCEVESCGQPAIRQHAMITHKTPGFPAWSVVKYGCENQGYQLSGPSVLVCQPQNFTKISDVKPLFQISLQTSFTMGERINTPIECLTEYNESLTESSEEFVYSLIHSYCSGMNVHAFHLDTAEIHSENEQINFSTKISLYSDNATSSSVCGKKLATLSIEMERFWTEKINSNSSCSGIVLHPLKTDIKDDDWHCWQGLTLKEIIGENVQPVCLEGCIDNYIVYDEMVHSINKDINGRGVTTSPFHGLDHGLQFHYLLKVEDESTTILPNTRSSRSETTVSDPHLTFSYTKSTPATTHSTASSYMSEPHSSPSIKPFTENWNALGDMQFSSNIKGRGSPESIHPWTSPSSVNQFELDNNKDRVYFNQEDFPSRSGKRNDQTLWKQQPRLNCSSSRRQEQASLKITATSLLSSSVSNGDDCTTNQMLEKQETKFVPVLPEPSANLSMPIYTVEMRDRLNGAFLNIGCVDAVHMIINAKVNEILQQFGQYMGKEVCKGARDASLELVAGNIRFKGTTARVYIKFAITYSTSPKSTIEECGNEFEYFVTAQLPKVLSMFLPLALRANCAFINYTATGSNLVYKGWACRTGYTLVKTKMECNLSPVNQSVVVKSGKQSFDAVNSLPRLKMTFNGVFNVLGNQRPTRSVCGNEYTRGISVALAKIEPYLQAQFVQCSNLYIQPSKNVSVLFTGKRVIAKASIDLVPLKTTIDLASMTKCSRFLSLHFREPSHLLTTVTLGHRYLPTCPSIRLMPHGVRANLHFIYYCPIGYYYEAESFKCIHELLPIYSSGLDLKVQGSMENEVCQDFVQQASVQLISSVTTEIRQRIHYKHICNEASDVILIPKDGHFDKTNSELTLKLTISITSLKSRKTDLISCMSNIHSRLEVMLNGPKSTLIQKVIQRCKTGLFTISRQARMTFTRWECYKTAVYNSATGQCDSLALRAHDIGVKTKRHKRLAESEGNSRRDGLSKPKWSDRPPSCIDITPPTFHQCPEREVIIVLDHMGPKLLTIPLPPATDNSGHLPRITYRPDDIVMPYKFSQNMTLTINAHDSDQNNAECNINIIVLDNVPPVITCPTESIKIPMPSPPLAPREDASNQHLLHRAAYAWDNSHNVTVWYDVVDDGKIRSSGSVMVKAMANDGSANMATCDFFVTLEENICLSSSLEDPVNGFKKCVETGGNPGGITCSLSCQTGKTFAVQPPIQYICANNNVKWVPHARVPACYDAYFPDFEIAVRFNISYRDVSVPICVKRAVLSVKSSMGSIIIPLCGTTAVQNLNFTVQTSESFSQFSTTNMVSSSIKFFVQTTQENSSLQSPLAVLCGSRIMLQLEQWINSSLKRQCRGRDVTPVFDYLRKNITCAKGWALVNSLCVQCPIGTYWSNEKCLECPVGSFQRQSGKTNCDMCTSGFSTRTAGAQNEDECLAICPVDSYSPDGLEPCVKCPVGMYQQGQAATRCNKCDKDDLMSQPSCQDICRSGTYSLNGKRPCFPCPLNMYNNGHAMTYCLPCPEGIVSKQEQATSLEMCQDSNLCKINPCQNSGECEAKDGQMICNCLPGFSGSRCENILDPCYRNTCTVHGVCLRDGMNYICSCKNGYTGVHCETQIDHCNLDSCVYGLCNSNATGFACICSPGFEGLYCDENTDNCRETSCNNGGQCKDLVNNYQCLCKPGYAGKSCELNIDDCAGVVCLHGGTCLDGIDSFTCLCTQGINGSFCETVFHECDRQPCQNGGICENRGGDYICTCTVGFTGKQCEVEVDFCESTPCLNDGVCSNVFNTNAPTFLCSCKEGFTGVLCQSRVDYCFSMPCHLAGMERCESGPFSQICHCHPGWTGDLCDENMNPCDVNRCLNGGSCVSHDGHVFSCACHPNFTGIYCGEPIDRCQPNSCHNKGECITKQGKEPICLCSHGFTGMFCEENIDECQSFPCRNGGSCQDGVNTFFCRCAKGYAGLMCDIEIDLCFSQPCQGRTTCVQNKGTFQCLCPQGQNCESNLSKVCNPNPCNNDGLCVIGADGFQCQCQDKYSGVTCEETMEQNCSQLITCLNGGVCSWKKSSDEETKPICSCPPGFSGLFCENDQESSFDLRFTSPDMLCHLEPIVVDDITGMSLCLWLQISQGKYTETFVMLELVSDRNTTNTFVTLTGVKINIHSTNGNVTIDIDIQDGFWHHICIVLNQYLWTVYKDGSLIQENKSSVESMNAVNRLQLHLGQPPFVEEKEQNSVVSINSLHISGQAFEEKETLQLSKRNHFISSYDDIFAWKEAKICVDAHVDLIIPSFCQINPLENVQPKVNENSMTVSFCPDDIYIVSENGPIVVTWKEPLFDSVSEIVSLEQNFHSGQALPHGHHLVSYVALDSQGNMASCSFNIFISHFTCIDPTPPANGARVCGEWHHGRYCIPSCLPYYMFVSPVPPFYLCGKDGMWNPPNGQTFHFPVCSRAVPPILFVYGRFQFEGPVCNAAFLQELQSHMTTILRQVDDTVGLCGSKRSCDYTQALHAECGSREEEEGEEDFRIRRDIQNGGVYTVQLNITLAGGRGSQRSHKDNEWILEDFVSVIKNSPSLGQYHLTLVDVDAENRCLKGSVVLKDSEGDYKCVECPRDYQIIDQKTCEPCPMGWYNTKPGEQACQQCPQEIVPPLISQNCQGQCAVGSYLQSSLSQCIPCPKGQYQDEVGATHCKPCPAGLSTLAHGSFHHKDCLDICSDGHELGHGDKCVLCPFGRYKNQILSPYCIACPFAWTTTASGATNKVDCSLKKCKPGHFLDAGKGSCLSCPQGTFQSLSGVFPHCQPCGVGLTTASRGTDSQSLCVEGQIDECLLGIHDCPQHTTCMNEQGGLYICECNFGKNKDGVCEKNPEESAHCDQLNDFSGANGASNINVNCQCGPNGCKKRVKKDYKNFLQNLAVYSMITSIIVVTFAIFIGVAIVIYRRYRKRASRNHVRLYRDEKPVSAIQNNAFEVSPGPISMICDSDIATTTTSFGDNLSFQPNADDQFKKFDLSDEESNLDFDL